MEFLVTLALLILFVIVWKNAPPNSFKRRAAAVASWIWALGLWGLIQVELQPERPPTESPPTPMTVQVPKHPRHPTPIAPGEGTRPAPRPAPVAAPAEESMHPAEGMVIVADLPIFGSGSERARLERRFRTVLPQLAGRCPDLPSESGAADVVVKAYSMLRDDAGLPDSLEDITEAAVDLAMAPALGDWPCAGRLALYIAARQNGTGRIEALRTVKFAMTWQPPID